MRFLLFLLIVVLAVVAVLVWQGDFSGVSSSPVEAAVTEVTQRPQLTTADAPSVPMVSPDTVVPRRIAGSGDIEAEPLPSVSGWELLGRVVTPAGTPVPDVRVHVWNERAESARLGEEGGSTVLVTDPEGRFQVAHLIEPAVFVGTAAHAFTAGDDALWLSSVHRALPGGGPVELVLELAAMVVGTVTDEDGSAIPGARVRAERRVPLRTVVGMENEARPLPTVHFRPPEDHAVDGASFRIDGIEPGQWALIAEAEGFVTARTAPLELPREEPVHLVLVNAGQLMGLVLDPGGDPVADAQVWTTPLGESVLRPLQPPSRSDSRGRFSFGPSFVGEMFLLAHHEEFAPSEPQLLVLEPGDVVDDLTLQLRQGGEIVGEVRDDRGELVDDGQAWIRHAGGEKEGQERVVEGRFRFAGLPVGDYTVGARFQLSTSLAAEGRSRRTVSATVQVRSGQTTEVFLTALAAQPIEIVGRVHRAGDPVGNGSVALSSSGSAERDARIEEDGSFRLVVDGPGMYWVRVFVGGRQPALERSVEVRDQAQMFLDLGLPTGALSGRMLLASGKPAPGVGLIAEPEDPSRARASVSRAETVTGSRGEFRLADLSAGRYRIRFPMWLEAPAAEGSARSQLGGLVLADGEELAGLELQLVLGGGVRGTVLDESGRPQSKAWVVALDEEGLPLQGASTQSDGNGDYWIGLMQPGRARIMAIGPDEIAPPSAPLRIEAEEMAEQDLNLAPAGSLRVHDPTGAIRVGVVDPAGFDYAQLLQPRWFPDPAGGGDVVFHPVPPGAYTLRVYGPEEEREERSIRIDPGAEAYVDLAD